METTVVCKIRILKENNEMEQRLDASTCTCSFDLVDLDSFKCMLLHCGVYSIFIYFSLKGDGVIIEKEREGRAISLVPGGGSTEL